MGYSFNRNIDTINLALLFIFPSSGSGLIYSNIIMQVDEEILEGSQQEAAPLTSSNQIFFKLMERVGAQGRYQNTTFVLWCILLYIAGGITLMPSFIFFQDPYNCNDSSSEKSCLDFVCGLEPSYRSQYILQPPTIRSITYKFGDYRCQPQTSELTWVITLIYSGTLVCVFFMALVGDMMGRKALLIVNLCLMIVGLVIVVWSQSLWMAGAGMFLCVFGGKNNFNVCLVYTAETVGKEKRQIFTVIIQTFYCVGGLANVAWYYALSDFQQVLIYFYLIPSLIVLAALLFFVRDSPISLITRYSAADAHKDLCFIAKINGVQQLQLTVEELRQVQVKYKSGLNEANNPRKSKRFSIVDLFRYKSLRAMTLMLMVMDFVIDLQFYTPTLMLDQFHFSIYINGLVVQLSQIIASIVASFIVFRLRRRLSGLISFGAIVIFAGTLVFIWDQDKDEVGDVGSNVVVLLFIFGIEFAITAEFNFFLVYINELFPTQVRVIGIGMIKTFGGSSLMLSALIISACKSSGFPIMAVFSVLAGLSMICLCFLPETFGLMPAEDIEELRGSVPKDEDA